MSRSSRFEPPSAREYQEWASDRNDSDCVCTDSCGWLILSGRGDLTPHPNGCPDCGCPVGVPAEEYSVSGGKP